MELYECVEKSKAGDSVAQLSIIDKFTPLIKKYNYKFFKDDISSELIITVIKCTNRINLNKFSVCMVGELVNYYSMAIRNTYIDLVKKSMKEDSLIQLFDDCILEGIADESDIEKINSRMQFEELLKELTHLQKQIIIDLYYYEKKEVEIAKEREITKQAVSNLKRRALQKLRRSKSFEKGELIKCKEIS